MPIPIKHGYSLMLTSIIKHVARTGLQPNFFSLASLPPAILAGVAAAMGHFSIAAALFAFSGAMDLIDGALARHAGQETRFGKVLDSSMDRLSDAAIPLGLVAFYAPHALAALVPALCLLTGGMISYVRARAQSVDIELPRLWMRRQDRFVIVIVALALAPISVPGLSVPAPVTLITIALLTFVSAIAGVQALICAAKLDK